MEHFYVSLYYKPSRYRASFNSQMIRLQKKYFICLLNFKYYFLLSQWSLNKLLSATVISNKPNSFSVTSTQTSFPLNDLHMNFLVTCKYKSGCLSHL
jgi:hypothetical protein